MMDVRPSVDMRKSIPFILLGLGLILIVASVLYILRDLPIQTDLSAVPVEVEYPAPELTLTDVEGEAHSLADYRGTVVLVNLWATWCEPCKEEMPALQAFHNKYADEGFTVIGINDGDPTKDVLQFVRDFKLTFPVWLDPKYIATEEAFKTMNLPTSYVIDRTGTFRFFWLGAIDRKNLERYVTPIIREAQ
ncbi:MAG TPA: TlpA disulfide reductase family protein [Anaerolineales bacterium]|nr:TlpA disulfide reductase family protein [Anaerolineales bacterium]